ncbi:family 20 glycosylhydrolase [Paenibacillus campi]|uniref:family 20 glycosylhydrolase n=1 Tax=Paenibacillus campi TaxID=3106031 RepID=UPI002B003C85|nr:family 20 glycosylhydrolase [Paenibacillus sp. SGZ-1014]
MKKNWLILMIVLLVVSSMSPVAAAQFQQQAGNSKSSSNSEQISVQQYTKNGTSVWKLQKGTRLYLLQDGNQALDPDLVSVVKLVDSELAAKGLPSAEPLPIQTGDASLAEAGDILIRLGQLSETSNSEAYKLEIADQIKLTAPTVRGILYGLRTIEQQLLVSGDLQYGTIIDYPTLAERSYHIDMARKFYTKDWLIQQVKESSWLKINTLELHFSESEGFRLESKVHPEVMSPQYITQAEMKEVLAVAKQYQVDIIPSLDSPGHLQYALRNHPEWKLKDGNGNSCGDNDGVCKGALDITNADAKKYIFDLLDEYAVLFKGSKYFNIGGDEFIDFSQFAKFPELQNYARNVLGIPNGTGIDTFIDYTNQVAEHMEKKGFIARVWNDGYFRSDQTEHVQLKKSIQIDYWTKWDAPMAPVQKFIDEGFKVVNFNDAYFYYVLGQNAGYKYPTGSNIYNNWHPGLFPSISSSIKQEYNPPYPDAILGASFAIWSDTPEAQSQEQVSAGIYEPLRAMAEKSWIGEKRYSDYAAFKSVFTKIGEVPGYDSALPTASDIVAANSVGIIYIHAVDDAGVSLYDSRMFGTLGSAYTLTPDTLYGYRLHSLPANASGTFNSTSVTINLVYDLKTDKSALQQAYTQSATYPAADYIAVSYTPYAQQLQQAKTVLDDARAIQTTIDSTLGDVKQAQSQLIAISKMQLYVLIQFPQAQNNATSSSYATYLAALEQAKPLLTDATASTQDVAVAVNRITTALQHVKSLGFTVTMNDNPYLDFSQAVDGNSNTYAANWDAQQVGDTIVFNFDKPVNLASFTIQYVTDFNYGRIKQADFQIAQLVGGSLQWKTIGTLDNSAPTITLAMNENDVQQARIVYTADTNDSGEGTLISELSFGYNANPGDCGIQQLRSIDTQSNSVHLQWNPVSGASAYLVYVNDDAQPIYRGSDPSFVHSNLQPNTVYTYRVMYVSGGVTSIPYFVQIQTLPVSGNSDTQLSALRIDQGQLSPTFAPSITDYAVQVADDVYTFDFTVTKTNPLQQLTVTGATYGPSVTADSYSYTVDMTVPQRAVTIAVQSSTGTTGKYTLRIARGNTP